MQVVGLRVAEGLDVDGVAARLAEVLGDRGTVGLLRAGEVDGDGAGDGLVVTGDGALHTRYDADGAEALVPTAIDRLADEGFDYAIVDARLVADAPTVAVGPEPDEGAVAALAPEALDDADRLAATADRIDALEPHETLGSLVRRIEAHPDSPRAGALATFTGRVRAENLEGARTTHLEYEKYAGVADAEIEAIRRELVARDGVYEVLMHHNTGVVPAEADAVHVVVLAGHRREAFRAVEDGIDLLKERVPIFKKEVTETGAHWAHDRP